ncbi:hypothetical protein BKA82DRAFT_3969337, partial [Pisolithus tinctorius]
MVLPPPIEEFLADVDLDAAASAFYAKADSLSHCAIVSSLDPSHVKIPRRPRPDASIHPSPWRPHVAASNRLICWSSPQGADFLSSLESHFPQQSVFRLFHVMLQSLDVNTRSNYGAGLLRFTQFCDLFAIPETSRMPAPSELISLFAAHHAGHVSEKTLNNWLAGLHFWHIVNGMPWNGDDMLRHVRRGFTKLVPPSSKRAKRPPITLEALCILHDCLNLTNTFDTSVWALASIAFWSCCR